MSVISSPGTPDLPEVERRRLMAAAGIPIKAAVVRPAPEAAAAATPPPKEITPDGKQTETKGTGSPDPSPPVAANVETPPDGSVAPGGPGQGG